MNEKRCLKCGCFIGQIHICKPPTLGNHLSEETRKKMSLSKKGKPTWNKGKTLSPEIIRTLSESHKGQKAWNKGKTKKDDLRIIGGMLGKHHSESTKELLSQINKQKYKEGKTIPSFLGKRLSEETKNKIRQSSLGRKFSEETRRKISESNKREKSYLWKGGISFKSYGFDFTTQFKESIKKRDNYCCQLCNIFEEDAKKLYKRILMIHHIDYNRLNSFPQNCISLCVRCHCMTNHNRDHWKIFFHNFLKERYDYEYTQDQKIILDFNQTKMDKL